MSRIDSHISRIRNKLAMAEFLYAIAQALLVAALLVLAYVVVRQFILLMLPREKAWLYGLLGASALYGMIVAIVRRPDEIITAVAIDDRLKLQEKFSTAIQVRSKNDPFSQAAVLDAERTATSVDLHKKFPMVFPKPIIHAAWISVIAASLLLFIEPRNIFASETQTQVVKKKPEESKEELTAKKKVKEALDVIAMAPKNITDQEKIQIAKATLQELQRANNVDPATAQRKAMSALQEVDKAIKEHITDNQKLNDAKNNERMLDKLEPGPDDKGPIADAQRDMAKGNIGDAMDKLSDAVSNFDKMNDDQKQQAADQMNKMAQQLKKLANDPQQQQKAQQQLQQMGLNQQQAQQAMNALQQAAQGNPQAQQQIQSLAQQALSQMNNGAGATAQQQQQVQQMIQQLQGQANTQAAAQSMMQAAQSMAQAMQQSASGQQGQQSQQSQQANSQQGQNGQQGNQGQQSNQGQNSQNNGQQAGGQTPQQQMAAANNNLQQQLQNMQAAAQDAQQVAAAQQAAQQAMNGQQGQNGPQGQNGQQAGQGQQPGQGQGQGQQPQANGQPGNQNQQPGQQGGPGGPGAGQRNIEEAPFTIKTEVSKSKDIDTGKVIAASLVKAGDAPKGESKAELREVVQGVLQDATDDVDSERVSRQGQNVVKDYFGRLSQESVPK